jgi:hypothetical protein
MAAKGQVPGQPKKDRKARRMSKADLRKQNTSSAGFPDVKDIDKVFGNVTSLLMLSEQLLTSLQERIGRSGELWNPSQKLGDIFIDLGPFFKVYKEYVKNFEDASAYLLLMRAEYPLFAQLLDQLRETQGNMDVASFLVMPVQRMPRYKMLLEELVKITRPEHRDYSNLEQALSIIRDVAMSVNTNITEMEKKEKVVELSAEIEQCPFELVQFSRLYVTEENFDVRLGGSEEVESLRVVLFNDIIVYLTRSGASAADKYVYKGHLVLRGCVYCLTTGHWV